MEPVLRAAAVYVVVFVLFRLTGKRTLAQITTFDLVLLLIVSEASQQALLGDDFSVTTAALVVATLILIDRGADLVAHRSTRLDHLVNDRPLVLIADGEADQELMDRLRIGFDDVMEQARLQHGLEDPEDVKHAVLERTGAISVIPRG